jgi:hypothetical protein
MLLLLACLGHDKYFGLACTILILRHVPQNPPSEVGVTPLLAGPSYASLVMLVFWEILNERNATK